MAWRDVKQLSSAQGFNDGEWPTPLALIALLCLFSLYVLDFSLPNAEKTFDNSLWIESFVRAASTLGCGAWPFHRPALVHGVKRIHLIRRRWARLSLGRRVSRRAWSKHRPATDQSAWSTSAWDTMPARLCFSGRPQRRRQGLSV